MQSAVRESPPSKRGFVLRHQRRGHWSSALVCVGNLILCRSNVSVDSYARLAPREIAALIEMHLQTTIPLGGSIRRPLLGPSFDMATSVAPPLCPFGRRLGRALETQSAALKFTELQGTALGSGPLAGAVLVLPLASCGAIETLCPTS